MTPVTNPKNLVAYIRLSKETKRKNGSGLGLESQQTIIEHFYGDRIVKTFTEVKSGKNVNERIVLQQAIEYCRNNGYGLVVAKVDRLSRSTDDTLAILKALNKKLICCDIPTDGYVDKFVLTLYSAIAERERELISIRTIATLKVLKDRGVKLGSPSNTITKETIQASVESRRNKAVINESNKEAFNLVELLRSKDKKMSFYSIANYLNAKGLITSKGNQWSTSGVVKLYNMMTT